LRNMNQRQQQNADKPPARGRPRDMKAQKAILRATRQMLGKVGYTRLTVEGVAAKSGAGKATIYRWWPTKGDLVLEAAGADIEIGVVPDTGDTREDLRIAIEQLITTFSKRLAGIVIFAAISNLDDDPAMAATFRDKYVYPWRKSAGEAIRRGIDRGDLPADTDAQFLLDVIVGTVLQRTVVIRAPKTEGLSQNILGLVLPLDQPG
jgi:AcrR family transcriptional regulator